MAKLRRQQRPDGTYFVYHEGDNMHLNHWHVAPDGTVLSVKEGGSHRYNRGHIRKHIREVTGCSWNDGWVPDND